MNKINLKGVSSSVWIRTAVLALALVNQALVIVGVCKEEADTETLSYYVSFAFTAISAVWSWWKNNSFTLRAQQADETAIAESQAKG